MPTLVAALQQLVAHPRLQRQNLCSVHTLLCSDRRPRQQSYGYAGVASYGLLNTAYYITAFIFFWTRVAKVPKGLGLEQAAKQFVGVMSLTWAGSQVTKVARIGAALAVAPFLDAACSRAQQQLGLKSQRTALSLVVALCLGVAALCFGGTVLLWA